MTSSTQAWIEAWTLRMRSASPIADTDLKLPTTAGSSRLEKKPRSG